MRRQASAKFAPRTYPVRYTAEDEAALRRWIGRVGVGEAAAFADRSTPLHAVLKDGEVLCRLMNNLCTPPYLIGKIHTSAQPFYQMENISNFITACYTLKFPLTIVFSLKDLWDGRNMMKVMDTLTFMMNNEENIKVWKDNGKRDLIAKRVYSTAPTVSPPRPPSPPQKTIRCRDCGNLMRPSAKFCDECGLSVDSVPAEPQAAVHSTESTIEAAVAAQWHTPSAQETAREEPAGPVEPAAAVCPTQEEQPAPATSTITAVTPRSPLAVETPVLPRFDASSPASEAPPTTDTEEAQAATQLAQAAVSQPLQPQPQLQADPELSPLLPHPASAYTEPLTLCKGSVHAASASAVCETTTAAIATAGAVTAFDTASPVAAAASVATYSLTASEAASTSNSAAIIAADSASEEGAPAAAIATFENVLSIPTATTCDLTAFEETTVGAPTGPAAILVLPASAAAPATVVDSFTPITAVSSPTESSPSSPSCVQLPAALSDVVRQLPLPRARTSSGSRPPAQQQARTPQPPATPSTPPQQRTPPAQRAPQPPTVSGSYVFPLPRRTIVRATPPTSQVLPPSTPAPKPGARLRTSTAPQPPQQLLPRVQEQASVQPEVQPQPQPPSQQKSVPQPQEPLLQSQQQQPQEQPQPQPPPQPQQELQQPQPQEQLHPQTQPQEQPEQQLQQPQVQAQEQSQPQVQAQEQSQSQPLSAQPSEKSQRHAPPSHPLPQPPKRTTDIQLIVAKAATPAPEATLVETVVAEQSPVAATELPLQQEEQQQPKSRRPPSRLGLSADLISTGATSPAATVQRTRSYTSLARPNPSRPHFEVNPRLEGCVKSWISQVVGDSTLFPDDVSLIEALKSGVILCRFALALAPDAKANILRGGQEFMQIENITTYNSILEKHIVIPAMFLFEPLDLIHEDNIPVVLNHFQALSKHLTKMSTYKGPLLSPLESRKSLSLSCSTLANSSLDLAILEPSDRKMFDWMDEKLAAGGVDLHTINNDIRTAVKLIKLVEVLTASKPPIAYKENPNIVFDCFANALILFSFIRQKTLADLGSCTAEDIVHCSVNNIVQLLRHLRDTFDWDHTFWKTLKDEAEPDILTSDGQGMLEDVVEDDAQQGGSPQDTVLIHRPTLPPPRPPPLHVPAAAGDVALLQAQQQQAQQSQPSVASTSSSSSSPRTSPSQSPPQSPVNCAAEIPESPSPPCNPPPHPDAVGGLSLPAHHARSQSLRRPCDGAAPLVRVGASRADTHGRTASGGITTRSSPRFLKRADGMRDLSKLRTAGGSSPILVPGRSSSGGSQGAFFAPSMGASPSSVSSFSSYTPSSSYSAPSLVSPYPVPRESDGGSTPRRKQNEPPTFEEVINTPALLRQFRKFLEQCDAVENLDFYLDARLFSRHEMPKTRMKEEAVRIYNKYCTEDSTHEANIAGEIRVNLKKRTDDAGAIRSSMFKSAVHEMQTSLELDLFPKYIATFEWKSEAVVTYAHSEKEKQPKFSSSQMRVLRAQNKVRNKITHEIVHTEENFIAALRSCHDLLLSPLTMEEKRGNQILSQDDKNLLFTKFLALEAPHKALMDELNRTLRDWNDNTTIGSVFLVQVIPLRAAYVEYFQTYQQLLTRLRYLLKTNAAFNAMVSVFNDAGHLKPHPGTLEQFLSMPIYRFPRYVIELSNLAKFTPKFHKDHTLLNYAFRQVKITADTLSFMVGEDPAEHMQKLLSIALSVDGQEENLLAPHRKFIREGLFMQVEMRLRKKKEKPGDCVQAVLLPVQ
eukprot:TRINITY_DN5499_c0_g1_i1.p1 TRINITY_DN5499_c0_g1~~TRINITY_DN5499_c0_g1_i1.p1  ORF type:complete len:1756 (-),score=441.48 TRINITY_DN5499_c0_g1_i1:757-6024(-)